MTMHTIFFKENEGINFPDPLWSTVVGSQPPPAAAIGGHFLELSAGRNLELAVAKESDQDQQVLAKEDTTHFTVFPDDCRTAENGAKATLLSLQDASMDYHGKFKFGFGQPLICGQYPYNAEQCYGMYSAYGAQIEGRRMLSMASERGPIFVNAKQYNGIMRRRRSRAKAELKYQDMKIRKPYMHLSRHLHAVRRHRGSGGRFLSSTTTKGGKQEQPQSTDQSQMSEVVESDGGIHSTKTNSSSSRGSEVTSYLHNFEFDLLQPSFMDVGIAGNYLKV